ncbi:hypothetical protein KUTeg_022972 [Tegillarca granosa]|uniref:Flavin-containing monooxygenase n=1 Tax=Tegillarca granosa TaxID=220873 RepID=A0ABQ9E0Y3_TEGGR|nr:hypothetical protein KUTeg_022972 [Tegillarca granosa]
MGSVETMVFDAVIVSNGYLRTPFMPEIDDFDKYEGGWSHMNTFKSGQPFSGKRVLVIVLYDWIWRRECNNYFDHKAFGIRPAKGPLHYFPAASDDLRSRVGCGKIKIISGTKQFMNHGVKLHDGTVIDNIDYVLFATGFQPSHNLLDKDTMFNAYKFVFPVNLPHTTLAMVGMLSATGAFTRIAEMQARFAALVLAGKHKLPDKNKMKADIRQKRADSEFICYYTAIQKLYVMGFNSGLLLADCNAKQIVFITGRRYCQGDLDYRSGLLEGVLLDSL